MQEAFCPGARTVENGRTPLERLHGKKTTQQFVLFGEEVLARPISSEPLNRMNPRYKFGVWLGVETMDSAECLVVHRRMPVLQGDQIWKVSSSSPRALQSQDRGVYNFRMCRASRSKNRGYERGTPKKWRENARRREEIGNTARELSEPQKLKDMPIPPDPDPR